jgi:hypothetical protein
MLTFHFADSRQLAEAKRNAQDLIQATSNPSTPAGKKKGKGAASAAATPSGSEDSRVQALEAELVRVRAALDEKNRALELKTVEFAVRLGV